MSDTTNTPATLTPAPKTTRTRSHLIFMFLNFVMMIPLMLPAMAVAMGLQFILHLSQHTAETVQGVILGVEGLALMIHLSRSGMTLRHFMSGYRIVNKDGSTPNFFKLYLREIVTFISIILLSYKILLPAMIKRGVAGVGQDEDHRFVLKHNDGSYSVTETKGQMRDRQMNAELQASMQQSMAKLHSDAEFMHDRMFGTQAVLASRWDALRGRLPGATDETPKATVHDLNANRPATAPGTSAKKAA